MELNKIKQSEKIFYQDKGVYISQSRFVANAKTYAMRNISSVTNHKIEKSLKAPFFLIIIGLIMMPSGGELSIFGILITGLGLLVGLTSKSSFSVQISSNSGESKALISKNQEYIQTIVDAINEAIIYRG